MEPKGKWNQRARGTELEPRPSAFFLGTLKPAAVLTPKVISLISSPSESKRGDSPGPGPSGTMPKVPRQPSNSLGLYGEIEDSTLQLPPGGLLGEGLWSWRRDGAGQAHDGSGPDGK